MAACCGHGVEPGYVQWANGRREELSMALLRLEHSIRRTVGDEPYITGLWIVALGWVVVFGGLYIAWRLFSG